MPVGREFDFSPWQLVMLLSPRGWSLCFLCPSLYIFYAEEVDLSFLLPPGTIKTKLLTVQLLHNYKYSVSHIMPLPLLMCSVQSVAFPLPHIVLTTLPLYTSLRCAIVWCFVWQSANSSYSPGLQYVYIFWTVLALPVYIWTSGNAYPLVLCALVESCHYTPRLQNCIVCLQRHWWLPVPHFFQHYYVIHELGPNSQF